MASIIAGYENDIFISYRQKDNKGDQWISKFVDALRTELEATFKESLSIYLDTNLHDGVSAHHDVDLSLREKVRSLVFIPVISQTYCDTDSFAWKNEFLPFRALASQDSFGLKIKVANGNVTSRILPIRIHDLNQQDLALLEKELEGKLRSIDFTYTSAGINRPLVRTDQPADNFNKTVYTDQINKVANALKEIIDALKGGNSALKKNEFGTALPLPATALVGRAKDLEVLSDLVDKHPVVSIVGSGGMGKTRLALELSHRLKEKFLGNVVFAPMAALTAASDVISSLANTLGIKEAEGRNLIKGISSVVGDRKVLIVLDNLEQVIEAAPQIAEIISNCPNLKILTTSRTPLKIRAEYEYALKPLSLPTEKNTQSTESLLGYPSVALFVDRAQKVNAGFQLTGENASEVVQICQRLDGLPLALELAAARIKMMSAKQLLQRLEHALDILTSGSKDLPERHQTLRTTIDWSHSLLTESEKQLFRRMAVFSGGCTMDAIEATCYDDNFSKALDEVASLMDKGLVQHAESSDRFMMLETIKEYAFEKLNAFAEANKMRSHQANYFLKVTAEIRQGLEGSGQLEVMKRGIAEEGNVQGVLDFLLSEAKSGDPKAVEAGMAICGNLFFYWHIRCKHIMARHYCYAFLNLPNCPTISPGKCGCLNAVGLALSTLGHHEQSIIEHEAARQMAVALKDRSTLGFALLGMFIPSLSLGKLADAEARTKEYFELMAENGSDFDKAWTYVAAGIMHTVKGEFKESEAAFLKSLAIQKSIPDLEGGGLSRGGLALLCSIQGNYDQAINWYNDSRHCFAMIGDRAEEARILEEIAWVYLKVENTREARANFLDSIRAYEDVGSVRGMGLALLGIAGVESVENRPSKAISIATAAKLFAEQEGIVNNYGEGFQGKVYLDNAQGKLTESEFAQAILSGKQLSLKDALQLAS